MAGRTCWKTMASVIVLVVAAQPALAQFRLFGRPRNDCCPPPILCPPTPCPPLAEPAKKPEPGKPEPTPKVEPTPAPPTTPPLTFEGGPAVRGATFAYATPNLQGDQLGIPAIAFGPRGSSRFPPPPGQAQGAVVVPSVRSFKIAENDSPFPRDRVYFGFNYYEDVNKAINRRFGSDFEDLRVYRGTFGLEKTFLDGDISLGLRLPVNRLETSSRVPDLGGESTAAGDLTLILKAALWGDREAGRVITTGLAVTAPTGPSRFAGFNGITPNVHSTVLQPFVGAVWGMGDFFVHGYSALDIPTDSSDVTMFYNDIGLGYFLYRDSACDSLVTAVVPTFEVHINTPVTHRGAFDTTDPSGTPDVIALTAGVTFELHRRATLALGFVTPVTGPRPFDWEVLAQFNLHFGATTPDRYTLMGY
jgi:hypothetical protein